MAAVRIHGRHYRPLNRFVAPLLSAALLASLAAIFAAWIHGQAARPLSVVVQGRIRQMNPKEVQAVVSPYLEAGFFDLDMRAVHDAVLALPWVEQAQVRRRWPDGVIVHVREREPVARWRDNSLVTADALVFSPPRATMPAGLPLLSGPETTERLMLQSLMHIGDMLAPAGLRVAAIRIDDRGAWSVELDTGMVMHLGRTQIEERLRRFSDITIPTLGDRLDQVAYVDLRYGSGFAVGWREKPAVPDMGEG